MCIDQHMHDLNIELHLNKCMGVQTFGMYKYAPFKNTPDLRMCVNRYAENQ